MKKREGTPFSAVGACSLLVTFTLLALSVLSMLSLNTVLAEKRLLESSVAAAADWYAADLEAETIFARLRSGETIPQVREEEGIYRFSCGISDQQTLYVELQKDGDSWKVLRWQAMAEQPQADQLLPVWDGAAKEETQ